MKGWRGLAPVAALAVAGCLASKADIVLLQDEIRTLRAMQARSDTTRRAQADSALMLTVRSSDSVRALSQRFGAFQANVGGELYEINKQLITIMELNNMSSKRIMDLRQSLDERAQSAAAVSDPSAPQAPTAAQLYGAASELLKRGSPASARAGFEELLRRYPTFESAAAALLSIAESYADERKVVEADSVYQLVVKTYPRSPDAPTALFKYGLSRLSQGKTAEAKLVLQQVMRDYPRSPEAELAEGRLKNIK